VNDTEARILEIFAVYHPEDVANQYFSFLKINLITRLSL
jgi:hypothetical protein